MNHEHVVLDTDRHYVIDHIMRSVAPVDIDSAKTILMQNDHNSERFSFEISKTVEGHDMSQCNVVRIHFANVEKGKKNKSTGIYDVTDLAADPEDENKLIFSWLISRTATKFKGSLAFMVDFRCVDDDGSIVYRWSTDINEDVTIRESMDNTGEVVDDISDILEQWKQEMLDEVDEKIGSTSFEPDHTHSNLRELNKIDSEFINDAIASRQLMHDHANKAALDAINQGTLLKIEANTEARHTHDNSETLSNLVCPSTEGTSDENDTNNWRLKYGEKLVRYTQDGAVITGVKPVTKDDRQYLRIELYRESFEEKSYGYKPSTMPKFVDFPISGYTEVENNSGDIVETGSEIEIDNGDLEARVDDLYSMAYHDNINALNRLSYNDIEGIAVPSFDNRYIWLNEHGYLLKDPDIDPDTGDITLNYKTIPGDMFGNESIVIKQSFPEIQESIDSKIDNINDDFNDLKVAVTEVANGLQESINSLESSNEEMHYFFESNLTDHLQRIKALEAGGGSESNSHSHDNKSVLDRITEEQLSAIDKNTTDISELRETVNSFVAEVAEIEAIIDESGVLS